MLRLILLEVPLIPIELQYHYAVYEKEYVVSNTTLMIVDQRLFSR
jgi:hypothetical protein